MVVVVVVVFMQLKQRDGRQKQTRQFHLISFIFLVVAVILSVILSVILTAILAPKIQSSLEPQTLTGAICRLLVRLQFAPMVI